MLALATADDGYSGGGSSVSGGSSVDHKPVANFWQIITGAWQHTNSLWQKLFGALGSRFSEYLH